MIYINRLQSISAISLSMVKKITKKNKSNEGVRDSNNQEINESSWTIASCKDFLRSYNAPLSGTKDILYQRVLRIKKLEEKELSEIWKYGVAKLRELCNTLHVTPDRNKLSMLD